MGLAPPRSHHATELERGGHTTEPGAREAENTDHEVGRLGMKEEVEEGGTGPGSDLLEQPVGR